MLEVSKGRRHLQRCSGIVKRNPIAFDDRWQTVAPGHAKQRMLVGLSGRLGIVNQIILGKRLVGRQARFASFGSCSLPKEVANWRRPGFVSLSTNSSMALVPNICVKQGINSPLIWQCLFRRAGPRFTPELLIRHPCRNRRKFSAFVNWAVVNEQYFNISFVQGRFLRIHAGRTRRCIRGDDAD